jgi:hypothetical protein
MKCLGLNNKPTAEVHPGHMLTGPKEEEVFPTLVYQPLLGIHNGVVSLKEHIIHCTAKGCWQIETLHSEYFL